jgi:hypothetical protein
LEIFPKIHDFYSKVNNLFRLYQKFQCILISDENIGINNLNNAIENRYKEDRHYNIDEAHINNSEMKILQLNIISSEQNFFSKF